MGKRRCSKHKPGEYLELYWEGCEPLFEAVYGHVDAETFRAALPYEFTPDENAGVRAFHVYGRMVFPPSWSDLDHFLRLYRKPAPGRFPLTVSDDAECDEA